MTIKDKRELIAAQFAIAMTIFTLEKKSSFGGMFISKKIFNELLETIPALAYDWADEFLAHKPNTPESK